MPPVHCACGRYHPSDETHADALVRLARARHLAAATGNFEIAADLNQTICDMQIRFNG